MATDAHGSFEHILTAGVVCRKHAKTEGEVPIVIEAILLEFPICHGRLEAACCGRFSEGRYTQQIHHPQFGRFTFICVYIYKIDLLQAYYIVLYITAMVTLPTKFH